MFSRQNRKAFTLIEVLVVVAIIAMMVAIMVPAVQKAMDIAKNAVVKNQFHSIEIGAELFKQDKQAGNGEYPDDMWIAPGSTGKHPGFISLAIQLVGRDLRGYDPTDLYSSTDPKSFRVGPYIKVDGVDFANFSGSGNTAMPFMLCKWGEPILYFRAAPDSTPADDIKTIYTVASVNENMTWLKTLALLPTYTGTKHTNDPLVNDSPNYPNFYTAITNKSLTFSGSAVPYKGDSFILISAGKDKIYGTDDDVKNFGD